MRLLLPLAALLLSVLPVEGEPATRVVLPNGMRVIAMPDPGTDVVAVELLLDVAAADEPAGKGGIRYLTQHLLLRGTEGESGQSMARRLAAEGGRADVSVGLDYVELYALAPAGSFGTVVEMVADMVRHPAFLAEEVERQKHVVSDLGRGAQEDAFQETYLALREGLYGEHPYGRSILGDGDSVAAVTREDLVSYHRRHYQPGRAVLAVCGGVSAARVVGTAQRAFGGWSGEPSEAREVPGVRPLRFSRAVARELPIRRAHLMVGCQAAAAGERGYYAMQLVDSLLSGRANARMIKWLRDELGMAYDVSSFYPTLAGVSHLVVYVVTEASSVEAARREVVEVLRGLSDRLVSADEVARAKRYLLGSYALGHQRLRERAYALAWYEMLGLGMDFDKRYAEGVQAVTAEEVQAAARSALERVVVAVTMPEG